MCRRHSDCEELVRNLEPKLQKSRAEIEKLREQLSRDQMENAQVVQSLQRQIEELTNKNRSVIIIIDATTYAFCF